MSANDNSQVQTNNFKKNDDMCISSEDDLDDPLSEERSTDLMEDIPRRGLIFESYNELYSYCEDYAKKSGWAIRKRSNIKKEGNIKYVQLVCSRALRGKSREESEPVSSQITGCSARIRAVLEAEGNYRLSTVSLEHNHLLSPRKAKRMRQHRKIDPHSRQRLFHNDDAGIRQCKSYHAILTEKGGHENLGYSEKDARNLIDKIRRLKLQNGEADALHKYFIMMQKNNTNFFYSMDLDEEGRLRNLFWADARSRAASEDFGDVITFDTTCLTNKYDMPFAPFVRVNHHGQSLLLGYGLLCDETMLSFIWIFEMWKTCMKGKSPKAIITDQCAAMKNAIKFVFPDAKDRWCLWHIMEKIPKNLVVYKRKYEDLKCSMSDAVYESTTIDDFENQWTLMREKYFPKGDQWLDGLYRERHRWVPVYLKDTFWAGMSTTQCSESINSYFDKFVKSTTTLKLFVEQYGAAMADKIEKEEQEDFNTFFRSVELSTGFKFEKQFRDAYTNTKFKEFQDELSANVYCNSWVEKEEGKICMHRVMESRYKKKKKRRNQKFMKPSVSNKLKPKGPLCHYVEFNIETRDIKCTCRLFEFRGILCRHVISVLIQRELSTVPNKYVLSRWRKFLKRKYSFIKGCYDEPKSKEVRLLHNKMLEVFYDLTSFVESEEQTNIVVQAIAELKVKVLQYKPMSKENPSHKEPSCEEPVTAKNILNPKVVKRIGHPTFKRKISKAEEAIQKARKRCYKRKQTSQISPNKRCKKTQEDEDDCDVGKNKPSSPRDYPTPLSNCIHPTAPENVNSNFPMESNNLSPKLSSNRF